MRAVPFNAVANRQRSARNEFFMFRSDNQRSLANADHSYAAGQSH
jgi:hypothetical protein